MDFIGILLTVSLVMMVLGLDQFFTVKYGEKWYPGLSASFWKLPDRIAVKLIFLGLGLFLLTILVGTMLNNANLI